MNDNYYAQSLNALKLAQVYETQLPRVAQYLAAEIDFVRSALGGQEVVLEVAAGYGRIMKALATSCKAIVGIDIAADTVASGQDFLADMPQARLLLMDARQMAFDEDFDVVLCLQNGLSAMKVEPAEFIKKVVCLLAPGGTAYFSSYSEKFWQHRLAWFQEQVAKGLLGAIDWQQTKDGVIACADGFRATTLGLEDMESLGRESGCAYRVTEVDDSSVFLILRT